MQRPADGRPATYTQRGVWEASLRQTHHSRTPSGDKVHTCLRLSKFISRATRSAADPDSREKGCLVVATLCWLSCLAGFSSFGTSRACLFSAEMWCHCRRLTILGKIGKRKRRTIGSGKSEGVHVAMRAGAVLEQIFVSNNVPNRVGQGFKLPRSYFASFQSGCQGAQAEAPFKRTGIL